MGELLLDTDDRVIAGCLANRQVFDRCLELGLEPKHFSAKDHLFAIFARMIQLAKTGESFDDANILCSRFPEHLKFHAKIALAGRQPLTMNIEAAVDLVKTNGAVAWARRKLLDLSHALENHKEGDSIADILRAHESISDALSLKASIEPTAFGDLARDFQDHLGERLIAYRQGRMMGIPTGIHQLDDAIYGWNQGALYTVAARAGVGKTTFACNVVLEAALRGYGSAFYTVEMGADEILEKQLSRLAKVHQGKMILGSLNDEECAKIETAIAKHSELPIHIRSVRAPRLDALLSDIRFMTRRHGLKLIVVDYVQLIKGVHSKRGRHEEITEITGSLKELARELQVPILLLAQLNRRAAELDEPDVTHLKDSGSIEQDSDVVLLIYVDQDKRLWLKIGKNRKGKRGVIELAADLATNYIGNMQVAQPSPPHWSSTDA